MILTLGMAWTTAQRDQLQAAIATGVLTVEYEGPPRRSHTYQSLDAMRRLLAEMNRQLSGAPAFRHASFSSGFNPPRSSGTSGSNEGGFDGGANG